MIQIVNIPITRDSTDYPWEEFLKGVESGQETLNKLLDDGYTVLHSSVIKDSESQRLHFVLYKPTHLVELDAELDELDAVRITLTQHAQELLDVVEQRVEQRGHLSADQVAQGNGNAALD